MYDKQLTTKTLKLDMTFNFLELQFVYRCLNLMCPFQY